jgi:hypothetical protein
MFTPDSRPCDGPQRWATRGVSSPDRAPKVAGSDRGLGAVQHVRPSTNSSHAREVQALQLPCRQDVVVVAVKRDLSITFRKARRAPNNHSNLTLADRASRVSFI